MIETRPILSGVRVLDFGRYVAGPYCATLLGYLGAEVIRIEKIGGSEDRYIAPICEGGEGGVFFQTACNKRSLTLDPGSAAGREIMQRLLRTADIVGAIANEARINPRGIGDIEIAETYSLVELPARDVDHVIRALRGATMRGRKLKVNRDLGIRPKK